MIGLQQGIGPRGQTRGALIGGAQQGFHPRQGERAMAVEQAQHPFGPARTGARAETGGSRGEIEPRRRQPVEPLSGAGERKRW